MKQCTKCGEVKPLSEFNRRTRSADGLQQHCKSCHKAHNRRHYEKDKSKYVARAVKWNESWQQEIAPIVSKYKAGGCRRCPEQREWVLDFHHTSRDDKLYEVSYLKRMGSTVRLIEELDKCEVLCRNCHADLHYQERIGQGKW